MYKRWEPPGRKLTLQRLLRVLKYTKTWQLVIILILLGFVAATFLRLNNLGMVELRSQVETADKAGDSKQTQAALVKLQHYVSSHMNTSLGKGVALPETFKRDYDAALERAGDAHNENSDVYQQAALECRARFQGGVASFRNDYVSCVANAVSNLPAAQQSFVMLPRPAAYQYNFTSPLISFDFAGLFVLLGVALTSVIVGRLLLLFFLRWYLKHRAKQY